MATLNKVVCSWTGAQGLPGQTVMYTGGVGPALADLRAFFNAFTSLFPTSLTISFPVAGDTINDATGAINGGWTSAAVAAVGGTSAAAYAAGGGLFINWQTLGIVNGRRVKGRTFIAPLTIGAYDTNGTLFGTVVTTAQTAATTLAATASLSIWHRPTTPGGSDGSSHVVTGAVVKDQVTSLKSRRT